MPKSLILGNGTMLAAFGTDLQMRDFYFPYVGMEDHTMYGHMHRLGVWVEGKGLSWLSDDTWEITPQYRHETLVSASRLRNETLGIEVRSTDFVHPVDNILIRRFHVRTLDGEERTIKFFFTHDFHIYGDKQKDTAFYEPYTNSIIHYRGNRYFLVGGSCSNPFECVTGMRGGKYASVLRTMEDFKSCGISSFSVGKANYQGLEGTWRDAEDGELERHTVEQGSVDSTIGIYCRASDEPTEVTMWLCAGTSLKGVLDLNQTVLQETPERLERNCHNYWKSWVNKANPDFGSLDPEHIDLYKRSLQIVRLHCDNHGGMLAAADSDIMAFNKDTYTYVWPRDGAFVSIAMDKAGYHEVTRRFFEFCESVQMPDGYLMHKFNPDGSLGSTWHPWFKDGEPQMPIQEDETALVLYALEQHFESVQDFEFLQKLYEGMIKRSAQFLCDFREPETGLPLPSYDPWEEQRGVFTYTTACTIAGLESAAKICHILGHFRHSERYQHAADEMRQGMLFHLFDTDKQRFVKRIDRQNGKTIGVDDTPDISICAVWKCGVLAPDDPRVVSTMQQLYQHLHVQTDVGGLARYTNDYYHSAVEPSPEIPGNPWILTTLWYAQWQIACAKQPEDLLEARKHLDWTLRYASPSGLLPEQLHALTGEPLSVAPLTWSHATYIETVLAYLKKEDALRSR